jgi:dihydroxy-acid dehydratase
MLRAVGFGDGDFEKPIVGVANGHSTMNPCNAGIQPLVDRAMAALKEEGAMPQVFGVPTVTDGIGMGTEGMKYSLVSREVIADAIETSVNGQCMDGVLVVGGCDKNMPARDDGDGADERAGIFVYAGTIKPGHWKGQTLTIVSPFEAVGAFCAGTMSKEGLRRDREERVSVGRRVRRHVHGEHDVVVVRGAGHESSGSSQMASPDAEKADSAARIGAGAGAGDQERLKPRDIITRKSIENAIALVMATGGSTNAVLHYLAIASARRGRMDDRRFRAHAPARAGAVQPEAVGPVRRRRFPSRRRRSAGAQDAAHARSAARRLHDDHRPHDGRGAGARAGAPRADQDVIRPFDNPMYAQGHLAILRGNLSPEGCVAKITGLKNPSITGPARVFDSEPK